jgi:hypothetical protein
MKINVSKTQEFIPKFNGNRDQPEGEQIKIIWKYPTIENINKYVGYEPLHVVEVSGGTVSDDSVKIKIIAEPLKSFKELVISIKNLESEIDGKTSPIQTTGDLLTYAEFKELYDEISGAIISELTSLSEKTGKN